MLLLLGEGHAKANDTNISDGFNDLVFVAVLEIVFWVLFVFVVLMFVVLLGELLLALELSLMKRTLVLLVGILTLEILSTCNEWRQLRRHLLFFFGLLLLLCLLLLLSGSLHALLDAVDLACKHGLLGLVYLELEDLFVLLGHPELSAFHLVRLEWWQVVKEAVSVVEDLDIVGVEPLPWLDVAVVGGKELVAWVEAVEEP